MGAEATAAREATETSETTERADEEGLREALSRGDHRGALALCARLHGAAIGRLCMAFTGSQPESEELVQETLLAAYDGFASHRGEGSVRAWLFGIARRQCARHIETGVRRDARLKLVHDATKSDGGEELVLARERAQRARSALAQLKPSEREPLLLRFEAGLSYGEIAEACGIDEDAARKRVSRALGRLRAIVSEES